MPKLYFANRPHRPFASGSLIDYAATAFFFLRQPSRPNPARPEANSGSAPGSWIALTLATSSVAHPRNDGV